MKKMKKNQDSDLNNYLFNKISDIEIRLKYNQKQKEYYINDMNKGKCEKINTICSISYLNDSIMYFKGMLKAYQEILSLLIGEDVKKL